jgi:hypothetical protein
MPETFVSQLTPHVPGAPRPGTRTRRPTRRPTPPHLTPPELDGFGENPPLRRTAPHNSATTLGDYSYQSGVQGMVQASGVGFCGMQLGARPPGAHPPRQTRPRPWAPRPSAPAPGPRPAAAAAAAGSGIARPRRTRPPCTRPARAVVRTGPVSGRPGWSLLPSSWRKQTGPFPREPWAASRDSADLQRAVDALVAGAAAEAGLGAAARGRVRLGRVGTRALRVDGTVKERGV